ncbi:MAG TPA: DUF1269 domain-containing protein [Vicinamibacterales bacterium]|jgi:uncharacterized membrane protein|nr:DUF1269 domain-containing protein [Vicinamibacterales bacterium]
MDKMLVVVFKDETRAYEGNKALRELHNEGSITLYAAAVIAKDAAGKVTVKQAADQGPLGTALGMATGGLVGLLGGPAGAALGAAYGGMTGSLFDVVQAGISDDFLNEVTQRLLPGKTAVVAEIDEEWVTPVDARMEALGGIVFRRARGEFVDAQIERQSAADKAEFAKLKAEHDQAVGEAKTKLREKLDAAQSRLQAQGDAAKQKVAAIKRQTDAKIQLLKDQAAKARGDAKTRLERRAEETRADSEARLDKLGKAWQLVKDAEAI